MEPSIWLIKLILAHLLTDFVLQPYSWVEDRNAKHFASGKLYLHVLVTAAVALIMMGWNYWPVALIILITHLLIDGWKSYQPRTSKYFIIDQCLHLLVILGCWMFLFTHFTQLKEAWILLNKNFHFWKLATAFIMLTSPAGILIGQLTAQWREKITSETDGLANAGKWIGMIERVVILIFVLVNQFSAIGLLVAAKGIIRFNEKDRQEAKTEYLVIGTLMSIGLSVITGLLVKML